MLTQDPRAVYLHIPFCKKICHYCAFNKYFYDGQPIDDYLQALDLEMKQTLASDTQSKKTFDTIYVGGGTPSALSLNELSTLLASIDQYLSKADHYEYTFEVNPGELSLAKCQLLKEAGVNRISMGVQSFNDQLLRQIGRNHRSKQVYESIDWLRKVGFENLSIDLIFRLPNQSLADFNQSLSQALALDLPHYSLYSLIIEQKTVFQQLMRQGKLPIPNEDQDADMFQLAQERLAAEGIYQYEISNFSKKGFESQHNLTYWQYQPYFGFGAGAHGFVDGYRYANHGPVHHYIKAVNEQGNGRIRQHNLSIEEQMEEFLFLGLRTTQGVRLADFERIFQRNYWDLIPDFIRRQEQLGLMICQDSDLRLSQKGLNLADHVFRELLGTIYKEG
ncbi:radical SAM family heme chaperone HemW [Vaginisenegalia massiliensis]|uniref:radical SAM family heme chaperone HemW n=1 Tax=Vaginisenegalia massiliensis TaxID=2058294 RepID=UPI000F51D998|nr:radical SAM family heme chaperone HemW [Vaginisenegalia massiliensis]